MTKPIYVPPPRTPRLPPVDQVNNADLMLGVVCLGLVMAFIVGLIVWAVMR